MLFRLAPTACLLAILLAQPLSPHPAQALARESSLPQECSAPQGPSDKQLCTDPPLQRQELRLRNVIPAYRETVNLALSRPESMTLLISAGATPPRPGQRRPRRAAPVAACE